MIIYRDGKFYRQFGDVISELPDDNEHRAGCESLRKECETLEAIGVSAQNSGLFRYSGAKIETWWDGEDRYSAKLRADYIGPRSAWLFALESADAAGFASPAEWIAAKPEAAQSVAKFGATVEADSVGPEFVMSASVKGAKNYR